MTTIAKATRAALAALALAAAGPGGAGCISLNRQYEGVELPTARLASIKPGVSTKQDVLSRFGPPTQIQRRDLDALIQGTAARYQGSELTLKLDPAVLDDVYVYEYRRVNRNAYVFVFFNYIKSDEKSDRLIFFFDRAGKVAGWGLTEGTKEL
ncbi:MAG TPA: hypothetical protein VHF22_04445 [Planctomycetota bacterium]|nr:hypothetical protein [Planctomycetota bacterium]